jgi:excisionase family DNA binding protein
MPEPLLTASEVAQFLRLNVETVYALVAKEDLPASKVGGQWRFEEAKIRTWLEARHAPRDETLPENSHENTRSR